MFAFLPVRLRRLSEKPRFWWLAFAAWFVALFILSSFSIKTGLPAPTFSDKIAHFVYFFAGGFALGAALLLPERLPTVRVAIITVLAMALVGAFDEWHQTLTPGRSGLDPWDWTADVLGGAAGFGIALAALRKGPRA